jgi:hypothetical protein
LSCRSRPLPISPGRPIRSLNRGISDLFRLAARSVSIAARIAWAEARYRAVLGTWPLGSSLRCTPLALPQQGMRFSVIVFDVAAPRRSAHHPGITPGGVICGDRDNSSIGRDLRAAGPRLPASTLIRTVDAAPGDHHARRHQFWSSGSTSMTDPIHDRAREFLRTEGSASAGRLRPQHLCERRPPL